jgi:hypothetical protein
LLRVSPAFLGFAAELSILMSGIVRGPRHNTDPQRLFQKTENEMMELLIDAN